MYTFIIIILLFEYSTAVTDNCYQSNNISCVGYSGSYVYCQVGHTSNYTLVTDALRSCTIGKDYQLVIVSFFVSELSLELQFELGDNVTGFAMSASHSPTSVSILPLKKHLHLTWLYLYKVYLNISSHHFLSINFPNLEYVTFQFINNIETMGTFLAGLKSLSHFYWIGGSLVNISENAFEGLTSLSYIDLSSNSISYLPSILFQGLSSLSRIELSYNSISYLPSTLFQGLPSLSRIELSYNFISYLPSTLFQGLSSLSLISLVGNPLNCSTCHLQWMSIVDSKFGIEIRGNCFDSNEPVGLVSAHSHCSSTESYQCFNKSVSCEQSCINTPSSYICACYEGFGLAEQSCLDFDECIQDASLCQGMKCRNTLGSYECYCDEGFSVEGNSCSDIDECISNPCEHNCTNIVSSFNCSCKPGFFLNMDGRTCQCETGFSLSVDGNECVDVDECSDLNGGCEHSCVNREGSYDCVCAEGFGQIVTGKEEMCVDIDECLEDASLCQGMKCRNTLGSYECYCDEGFYVEGNSCSDIDECTSNPCEHNCTNIVSSFNCSCKPGFFLNMDGRTCKCESGFSLSVDGNECVDVDECSDLNGGCEHSCVNREGSYGCVCAEGFGQIVTGKEEMCVDIDECVQNASLCQGMKCRNTLGSYECYCDEGFFVEGNSCSDIDECTSNPCEYSCNNTVGSYQCLSDRFSQISASSQSVSSLTAFFIAVSGLEALLLVLCSVYVIVTCTLYFKSNFKRTAKDMTRSDSPGPQRNEDVYLHEIAENAF